MRSKVCVGGILLKGSKILLGKRSSDLEFYPGVWDTIGGHCENNETPEQTLSRELQEEIGVTPTEFTHVAVLHERRGMNTFRLPDETHIGYAHLQVSDLRRAVAFYADLVGLREVNREDSTVALSATGGAPYHILLTERPGARPKPSRTTGLYHVAIRLPNRRELARVFRHLLERDWPFHGYSDHKVSEALYLADPDGNGLELYTDRPRESWPWAGGQVSMTTDPLDAEGLLREVAEDKSPWTGIHPQADIGHVHLHVSSLARAEAFYSGLLGLDVTQRSYPGALFLSAGGYHHHLGLNIWAGAGAPPPPPDAVGLLSFSLRIPDGGNWHTLKGRIQEAGTPLLEDWRHSEQGISALVRDPDRNGVEISVERS